MRKLNSQTVVKILVISFIAFLAISVLIETFEKGTPL